MAWSASLAWAAAIAIAAALTYTSGRRVRLRGLPNILATVLAGAACYSTLGYLASVYQPRPAEVGIQQPAPGTVVERGTMPVAGFAAPPGAAVKLLVRSETDPRWWVQAVETKCRPGENRCTWSGNAILGEGEQGVGESFHLLAVASADGRLLDLLTGRTLEAGQTLEAVPKWRKSPPVVVWRRR